MASETVHEGELWFPVLLAGKSPKEEAIICLITLTIPLWKSIRFLLWIAAQEQPAKSVLSGTFTHWLELLFSLKAGAAHIFERWCEIACARHRGFSSYSNYLKVLKVLFLEVSCITQFCVLGKGDAYSMKMVPGLKPSCRWRADVSHSFKEEWKTAPRCNINLPMAQKTETWPAALILGPTPVKFLFWLSLIVSLKESMTNNSYF